MVVTPVMVISAVWCVGLTALWQSTVDAETHAAVPHSMVSTRPLDVLSLWPKLRPETVTEPSWVRALLSTPR